MTPQQQAEAIVEKYYDIIVSYLSHNMKYKNAIQCAITEVEACIDAIKGSECKIHKFIRYQNILEHLKQM